MDIGVLMIPEPGRAAQTAQMVEQLGFDHMRCPDSQNLVPEVWGQLMLAAGTIALVKDGPLNVALFLGGVILFGIGPALMILGNKSKGDNQ